MSGESFAQRVQNLRDAWSERREIKGMAGAHDFDSQFRLIATLHGWAEEAVREIQRIYGEEVSVSVSPAPTRDQHGTAFSVFLARTFTLTFALTDRPRMGHPRWFVVITAGSPGAEGSGAVAAGPERRNGHWTRGRLEDLLLSLLGAWERSHSDSDSGPAGGGFHAPGA